jgi:hypothetical protein
MNSVIKVIIAIAWAVLLFLISAVVEQLIKWWLLKKMGVCPVCTRRGTYANAQNAQLV